MNSFQKKIVNEIVKIRDNKQIDLIQIFKGFLPEDIYIGNSELFDSHCVWYRIDKQGYIYGDLSIKILDFINLMEELVKYNYVVKVENSYDVPNGLIIGKKVDNKNLYLWYRLGVNLSYNDLKSFFLKYQYFPTEDLYFLPKHKYMQIENYRAERSLFYLKLSVFAALITTLLSFLTLLFGC